MADWFIVQDGAEAGPFATEDIRHRATQGEITPEMPLRRGDMDQAVPAAKFKGLFPEPSAAEPPARPARSPRRSARRRTPQTFASLKGLATTLTVLLGLCIRLDLVVVIACLSQRSLVADVLAGETIPEDDIESSDLFYQGSSGLQALMFLGTAVVFLVWIYRASKNQRALSDRRLSYAPGWAIGCGAAGASWPAALTSLRRKPSRSSSKLWKLLWEISSISSLISLDSTRFSPERPRGRVTPRLDREQGSRGDPPRIRREEVSARPGPWRARPSAARSSARRR